MNNKKIDEFNDVYNRTYNNTLKYVLLHCNNIDDVKEIVQESYLYLYKNFKNKKANNIDNIDNYIIGISKNIIKKHYRDKYNSFKSVSIYQEDIQELKLISDIDIELDFITKDNAKYIWHYIAKKDIQIAKIFYCYYYLNMKIIDIANEMNLNKSTVKNYLYRTIKELKEKFKGEVK